MKEVIAWMTENPEMVALMWAAAIGVAQVVVRFTPTDKDDGIPGMLAKVAQGLRNILTAQKPSAGSKDIE